MIYFNEGKDFFDILKNNISVVITIIVFGSISLGIIGFIIIGINAYYLGVSVLLGVLKYGPSFLLSILPHGIFEIPGLVMSLVILWEVNKFLFTKLFKRENKTNTLKNFGSVLNKYFVITILLIFFGALVEGYITPILIERYI
jgi:stage II sporulation protein M